MTAPNRWRRRRRVRLVAAGAALAALLAAVPITPAGAAPITADVPPQEPGVTLRSYDMGAPLSALCTLKPAQTPNVDKLMPHDQLDHHSRLRPRGPLRQRTSSPTSPRPRGDYTFRLTSDDGSRLTIDDSVVIDHDGLHGATSKEGSTDPQRRPPRAAHRLLRGRRRPACRARMAPPGCSRLRARAELRAEHRRRRRAGHRPGQK